MPRLLTSWPGRKTGWSRWPSARSSRAAQCYNPLVLYGPSGTGKSHLALGLAAAWKARDVAAQPYAGARVCTSIRTLRRQPHTACADYIRQRVVCTTAVDFARELADAIETQAVEEFRAKHRGAAMLVVEDLGQLATRKSGKLSAQEELVHTLDALVAEGRWVVVTASARRGNCRALCPCCKAG